MIGLIIVLFAVVVALFSPFLAPYSPNEINLQNKLSDPSIDHPFGTDQLGRDIMSRVIFGTRIALEVALPSILLGLLGACMLGALAGYIEGSFSYVLLVLFDILRSFPTLIFAITVIALTAPNLYTLIIIIAINRLPKYGRLIRGQALSVKENDYVKAAEAYSSSTPRILFFHILPNTVGPAFIQAAMDIPVVITIEAGLSFLGLGVPPPTPSWGTVLKEGYNYIRQTYWLIIFGGGALMITTLGFTLFGEALRDALDPKLRTATSK